MSRRAVLISTVVALAVVGGMPASALDPPPEQLPDGDRRPVVVSAELLEPQGHNALLEADLRIEAEDNDGIDHFEYRWSGAVPGDVLETSLVSPAVSYTSTLPETPYRLEVRAVDVHGWESGWFEAWSGVTPSAPMIVVAGDSIASGYTKQWFTRGATCQDADYSFGSTVHAIVAAALPAVWAPGYANTAFPGAGVNSVLNGGSDSCSDTHPSQIEDIARYTEAGSWNVVVMTAGINSTNWVDVVKELTRDTVFSFTDAGDKLACEAAVTERWDLVDRRADITESTSAIVEALASRTNAAMYWASYFAIDGSTIAPGWSPIGPECADEMAYALGELHGAIRAGLDTSVTWVDVADQHVPTQGWAGWPHPSRDGHQAIGQAVAAAIIE
jgi:hypothetical protein